MKIKYLLFFPGYAIVWLRYHFPSEWGSKRSVTESARQWKHKDAIAIWYSILFYVFFIVLAVVVSKHIRDGSAQSFVREIQSAAGDSSSSAVANDTVVQDYMAIVVNLNAGDKLNVRKDPTTKSNIVGSLLNGESVRVTGARIADSDGTIWRTVVGGGKIGWVNSYYLKKLDDDRGMGLQQSRRAN